MIGLICLRQDEGIWDGERPRALASLGGLPLLERQIKWLQRCGCQRVMVIGASIPQQVKDHLAARPATKGLTYLDIAASDSHSLATLKEHLDARLLLLMDHSLCSIEFLRDLVRREPGICAVMPSGNELRVAAACLDSRQLFDIVEQNPDELLEGDALSVLRKFGLREVTVENSLERGSGGQETPPSGYCFGVLTREDFRRGLNLLIESTQKGFGDFMGQYLHRRPENWLVRRLVDTPVTPNQVSIFNIMLGLVAAGLFATGWFRVGVLLVLPLGILDGVDGKLARVRMAQSRLGAFLDGIVTDKLLQTFWVMAIAAHAFWGLGRSEALPLLVAFLCGDNLTRIVSTWYKRRFQEDQLEHLPRFRKIRAGRNSYVFILALSALLGSSVIALWGIASWSLISFAFRAAQGWMRARRANVGKSFFVGAYPESKGKRGEPEAHHS